ncbi:hypothetical protein PoB_005530300 [Plakobranchus ocellatus]|uniref:Uncharacterized protein n=1 Tax=Plakobranchus ocellatus TaxID=259542 RepID=A0AAV4CCU4_9GAST|nr:hypothetical protein PoB_005530300 [Plakobranchus ocellatus]
MQKTHFISAALYIVYPRKRGIFYIARAQEVDLRFSGPPSGQSLGGRARNRDRRPRRSQGGFAVHCATDAPALFPGWGNESAEINND